PRCFLGSAQVPPILAQSDSQCGACAGAPGGEDAARHTPGAFVRVPRSRPLSEPGTRKKESARPGCDRARAGEGVRCTEASLGQGRRAPPGLVKPFPGAKPG
ncbi:hypothetical protein H1C71_029025, partial [Ictidomys tridecemlineatus]